MDQKVILKEHTDVPHQKQFVCIASLVYSLACLRSSLVSGACPLVYNNHHLDVSCGEVPGTASDVGQTFEESKLGTILKYQLTHSPFWAKADL